MSKHYSRYSRLAPRDVSWARCTWRCPNGAITFIDRENIVRRTIGSGVVRTVMLMGCRRFASFLVVAATIWKTEAAVRSGSRLSALLLLQPLWLLPVSAALKLPLAPVTSALQVLASTVFFPHLMVYYDARE